MNDKSFDSIKRDIEHFRFNETFDLIVAVANGGIIPAAMLNQRLGLEIQLLKVHFRDPKQQPEHPAPVLQETIQFTVAGKKVLLVEDRVKTGASLDLAKEVLLRAGAASVKTFAVNGKADYSLFNETCFRFPWILDC
jgi:uncharacterized protein